MLDYSTLLKRYIAGTVLLSMKLGPHFHIIAIGEEKGIQVSAKYSNINLLINSSL